MKKKIQYGAIIISACCFVYLFIMQVLKVKGIFTNVEKFTLMPLLIAVVLLVALLCHGGLYVLIMDRKEMRHVVVDDDEWWTKWDRV
ncbi:hypothetical protein SAMN04487969_1558 [Paenibacillus algorifonticola]|uniref:Uncharacterized protein n=1 Tax=Paenibacillus algorifonticola TaxID=684063 RepID=A0A1I2J9I2_9BACL|nr:hypothetical protein [Paenibacillus algorifonticola]SFF49361.1 hypothetical protein SAMN04487969_1558 [Paenibacillus algorifonticola]